MPVLYSQDPIPDIRNKVDCFKLDGLMVCRQPQWFRNSLNLVFIEAMHAYSKSVWTAYMCSQ